MAAAETSGSPLRGLRAADASVSGTARGERARKPRIPRYLPARRVVAGFFAAAFLALAAVFDLGLAGFSAAFAAFVSAAFVVRAVFAAGAPRRADARPLRAGLPAAARSAIN